MKVGYCTAVMNRRWQLEETLAHNLACLRGTGSFLALCDYRSEDGLGELVEAHRADVEEGTLLHFRTEEPRHFQASRAKNLAHRLALLRAPEVLFNLDADNFISAATRGIVRDTFAGQDGAGEPTLHNWSTHSSDGSFGRIALRAERWAALGGYDEALIGTAWEDVDLLVRCRAAGLRYVLDPHGVIPPIHNTMADRVANLAPDSRAGPSAHRYYALCEENMRISMARPCQLSLDSHRRFEGRLNFRENCQV